MVVDDSLKGLLSQLDTVAAAARIETAPRRLTGPRVPHLEDEFLAGSGWQPPLSKKDIKEEAALAKSKYRPPFVQYNKTSSGDLFDRTTTRLKPCIFGIWQTERLTQPDKNFKRPKDFKGYRAHHQSEPIAEPHDGLCAKMHYDWLQSHYAQRDKHLYPAYHALEQLEGLQQTLPKVESAIKRAASSEVDTLTRTHQKVKEQIAKVKSEPALQIRAATPAHEVRHLRRWAGNDMSGTWLQKTTYGRDQDEQREISSQKMTFGQTSFKQTGRRQDRRHERPKMAATITTTLLPADVHAFSLSEAGSAIVGM